MGIPIVQYVTRLSTPSKSFTFPHYISMTGVSLLPWYNEKNAFGCLRTINEWTKARNKRPQLRAPRLEPR
jgi:hypothetical protein